MSFAPAERCRMLVQGLAPRERRALLGTLVLILAAALLLGVEHLLAERTRLERRLPQLAASLARLEIDAAELARLRAAPRKPAMADTAILTASARAYGLDADIGTDGSGGFRLGGQADLAALLRWLGELHAEYGLRVMEMTFDGTAGGAYTAMLGHGRTP